MRPAIPGYQGEVAIVRYHLAWQQWQDALLSHDFDRADYWKTQLQKLRAEVD